MLNRNCLNQLCSPLLLFLNITGKFFWVFCLFFANIRISQERLSQTELTEEANVWNFRENIVNHKFVKSSYCNESLRW